MISQTLPRQTTDFFINGSGVSSLAGDLGLGSPEVTSVETAALAASAQANAVKPPPVKQKTKTGALNNSMSMNVNALANYRQQMHWPVEQILRNSFVVTINEDRFSAFTSAFKKAGFQTIPKRFIGYEISNDYLIDTFKIIAELKNAPMRGTLEHNLQLMQSIFNSASHFAIVQHAMLSDMPFVTIFEDDAVPAEDCIDKLANVLSNVPDDTDILRLGWFKTLKQKHDPKYVPPEVILEHFVVENYLGSHAYIVFRKYYRRFLEITKDHPKCDYERINPSPDKVVYALKESLFTQINIMEAPVMHSYKFADGKMIFPRVT